MKFELNNLYNMDCMEAMKDIPDNYFELAIVDPPYGIGVDKMQLGNGSDKTYRGDDWDSKSPDKDYFKELKRVSKNQIIWGANHFIDKMPINSSCWIFWDKNNGESSFADGELAWTSFDKVVKKVIVHWCGSAAKHETGQNKIHPTQKPIKLYKWLLTNYAEKGDKILDTHVGSASSLIACYDLGFDYVGFELDEEYYNKAQDRLKKHMSQLSIFKDL